jgi:LysM repeat protein
MKASIVLIAFLLSVNASNSQDPDVKIIRGSDYFDSTAIIKNDSQSSQKKIQETTNQQAVKKDKITYHTVVKSQTLYSISKMYGKTVDQLKEWNNLPNNNINVGQKLIVDKASEKEIAQPEKVIVPVKTAVKVDVPTQTENVSPASDPESPGRKENVEVQKVEPVSAPVPEVNSNKTNVTDENVEFSKGRKEINETGTAICMDEEEVTTEKYYALHKSAPIGTIIWITNISNAEKVYVKVIGNLPDSRENQGAIIKISKLSAEKLGVKEKKFEANLIYGVTLE